jgi:hypothetical protein
VKKSFVGHNHSSRPVILQEDHIPIPTDRGRNRFLEKMVYGLAMDPSAHLLDGVHTLQNSQQRSRMKSAATVGPAAPQLALHLPSPGQVAGSTQAGVDLFSLNTAHAGCK